MAEQLKPCPFCGNAEPEFVSGDTVYCENCWASAPYDTWNRRTPGPATRAMLELWQAQRVEHKQVGIPEEVIRVTPNVVDAVLAEWCDFVTPASDVTP